MTSAWVEKQTNKQTNRSTKQLNKQNLQDVFLRDVKATRTTYQIKLCHYCFNRRGRRASVPCKTDRTSVSESHVSGFTDGFWWEGKRGVKNLFSGSFCRHSEIIFLNDLPYFFTISLSVMPVSRDGGSFWRVSINTYRVPQTVNTGIRKKTKRFSQLQEGKSGI